MGKNVVIAGRFNIFLFIQILYNLYTLITVVRHGWDGLLYCHSVYVMWKKKLNKFNGLKKRTLFMLKRNLTFLNWVGCYVYYII